MTTIVLPDKWRRQPSYPVQLSQLANDSGIGIALTPFCNGYHDSTNRLTITGGSGTRSNGIAPYGRSRQYTAAADYLLDSGLFALPEYMWVLHGRLTGVATWAGLAARTNDNATSQGWGWQRNGSADELRVYHGGSEVGLGTLNDLLDGKVHTLVGIGKAGSVELWRDGALIRSGSIVAGPAYTAGQGQIKIGSSRDNPGLTGDIGLFALGARADSVYARAISMAPFSLLRKRPRILHFNVAAGGGGFSAYWARPRSGIIGAR